LQWPWPVQLDAGVRAAETSEEYEECSATDVASM
jgi:hypothetical protein